MLKKFLARDATQENLERTLISIMFELANRAERSKLPFCHTELIFKWKIANKLSGNSLLVGSILFNNEVSESL